MFEWWQALLLSLSSVIVGGLLGLFTGYVQRQWTSADQQGAEEREAARRVQEEQREVKRRLRRERIQPIFDFLDCAKRFAARELVEKQLEDTFKDRDADPVNYKAWQQLREQSVGDDPGAFELIRATSIAAKSAPTLDIRQGVVFRVFIATIKERGDAGDSPEEAVTAAERLIEKYLSEVYPFADA